MKFSKIDLAELLAPDKIEYRNRITAFFGLRIRIYAIIRDVSQPPVSGQRHLMWLYADLHSGELLSGIGVIKAGRVIPFMHDDSDLLGKGGGGDQRQTEINP